MAIKGFLPRTLKSRMTSVVILLVLGATTIVTTVALLLAERDMKGVIGAQQFSVLSSAAAYVDEQLETKRAILATLPEGLPVGVHSTPDALQALLDSRPVASAEFFNIVAFDRNGRLVATLRPGLSEANLDASTRPFFKQTVRTKAGVMSDPFISRISGRPIVLLTQPVLDPHGEVAYVIAGSIDLQKSDFFGPISGLKPGKTGFMFIMTGAGILIHHPDPERLLLPITARPGQNLGTEMALDGFEGWTEAANKDGSDGIYSYKRLRSTDWIVAARYPTDEAFAPMIALRQRAILAASVFAALAGLLGWIAINRLLDPLERLRSKLGRIHEHGADIDLMRSRRQDEIGELAEAFYKLTAERAQAQERTRDSETLVRNILEHAPDAFVSTDSNGIITEWNAQAEKTFGWSRDEAIGRDVAQLIVPPAMRGAHVAGMLRFQGNGTGPIINSRVRVTALHRDGHEIPVELSVGALQHGDEYLATAFLHDVSERVAFEERIAAGERRAHMIADNMPALVAYVDRDLRYRFTNSHYQVLFGMDPRSMLGKTISEVFGEHAYGFWRAKAEAALRGERVHSEGEAKGLPRPMHMLVDMVPDFTANGEVAGFYFMAMDITQRKNAELTQAASEKRLKLITDHLPVLIAYIDREHKLRFGNATFQRWLDIDPATLSARPLSDTIGAGPYEKSRPYLEQSFTGEVVSFEQRARLFGQLRTLETTFVPDVRPDGSVAGVYALTHDMTRIKAVEQQLIELTQMDTLTGIANRRKFDDVLGLAMQRSRRYGRPMALAYLDIDHFKAINDQLGHAAGDAVLKEFSSRLVRSVRAVDLVARLAGDEFVIVFEHVERAEEAEQLAAKIVSAVRGQFIVAETAIKVTTSIGLAMYDGDCDDMQDGLIARADAALYAAKRQGRDCFVVDKVIA
jgi:diguanylate cyclase (GGDEF)-like protein/PAS domain S-box-containing protein